MQKTTRLRSFTLAGDLWETHIMETTTLNPVYSGSPSIRHWNAMYARPSYPEHLEDSDVSFRNALSALRLIKPIASFSVFTEGINSDYGLILPAL